MTSRGRWLAALWIAFVGGCALVIARTEFNADLSAFLPRSPTPTQQILVGQLRDSVVSRLILIGVDGASPDALARISRELAARLRGQPAFATVSNGERTGQQQDVEFLWRNRYVLSPAVTPQHFSASGLRDGLQDDLDWLASPLGPLVKRVLPADPGGEFIGLLDQIEGQSHPSMHDGVWFSRDGSRAMLLAQTRVAGSDLDAQEGAMHAIERAFDAVRKDAGAARLRMTGPGVFSVQSRAAIRDDAMRFSLIATLLISVLLLLLYRSPRALVLGLLPVASGALAGVSAVSLGFGSVHGITLGFGVTLIGEGVDYAIYLFTQIVPHTSPGSTLQRIWPTLRLGVVTSICGFSAMLFSGFTGLAQLGMFSITGLIVAVTVTRWLLPELLPPGFFVHSGKHLASALTAFVRMAPAARMPLLVAVLALLAFLIAQRGALWNDNLASLSPVPADLQAIDQQLRTDLGAPDMRYLIVVTADDQQAALQRSEAISSGLTDLVRQGVLKGFASPSQILPSLRMQQARRAALPDDAALRRSLDQALRGLPFRHGLFEPFLKDVASARQQPPLDYSSLQGSSLAAQLDALLVRRGKGWAAMLPLRGVSDLAPLTQLVSTVPVEPALLLDLKQETEQMFREYRHEVAKYAVLGALAIVILLSASLRSWRRVLHVTLPLAAAVIVVTAGLVASGHALTLFHLIGLLLVVAIGSNYALFFDRMAVHGGERERTIASLLFANISTVIGFGLLSFSQAPVLSAIGSTVALGAALSLLFSAILIAGRAS